MDIGEQVIVIRSDREQIGTVTGFIRRGEIVFVEVNGFEEAVPSSLIKKAHGARAKVG